MSHRQQVGSGHRNASLVALVSLFLSSPAQGKPRDPAPVAPIGLYMSSSEKRLRVINLKVRCSPEEAEAIKNKAMDSGVSVSEFMRCAALKRKTRSTIDSQVIGELKRLGGLQKNLFNEFGGLNSKELAANLLAIKEAINRIES
jgi:hypothetical protein